MDCKHAQEQLSALLDGELAAAEAGPLQAHLDHCARCRAALADLQALQSRVTAEASYYAAPPHLAQRIQAALRTQQAQAAQSTPQKPEQQQERQAQDQPWPRPQRHPAKPVSGRRQPWNWPWNWISLGVAATACTAFAVTLALYLGQPSRQELMEQELVASHFRALMPDHLADVASTDQHTVKPWFAGKLDFSPPVYDLAALGYPLVGGRLDYLQQRPVAALAYRHKLHIMNLYIWPVAGPRDQAPQASERQGFHLLRWTQDGMAFAAVSDMNAHDLADFAGQFRDKVARSAAQ